MHYGTSIKRHRVAECICDRTTTFNHGGELRCAGHFKWFNVGSCRKDLVGIDWLVSVCQTRNEYAYIFIAKLV